MRHNITASTRNSVMHFARRRVAPAVLLAAALLLAAPGARASARLEQPEPPAPPSAEYAVKAAYLYNFLKFVEWPEGRLPAEGEPFVVCILGRDPFGAAIDRIEERTVRGHPLRLIREPSPEQLAGSHIVFVGEDREDDLDDLLQDLARGGALTVGDLDGFAESGGVIGFTIRDNRVGLDVNIRAADRARLRISAKLLELANVVTGPLRNP